MKSVWGVRLRDDEGSRRVTQVGLWVSVIYNLGTRDKRGLQFINPALTDCPGEKPH